MSKEPKPPNKPTNEHNPIICGDTPTPEKKKQEFEVMENIEEDEDYALSLDYLDGYMFWDFLVGVCPIFCIISHRRIFLWPNM